MKNKSRRSFLKYSLLGTAAMGVSPVEILFSSMIEGFVSNASAQVANLSEQINYLHLSMLGGPPRWYFDLPLKPNGVSDNIGDNKMLITKLDNSTRSLIGNYELYQHNDGYYYPHLWSAQVPTSSGGLTNLSNLLDNSAMFRGINLGVDGHAINSVKQDAPLSGEVSLAGLVADKSSKPIPAASVGLNLNFKSRSGVGIIETGLASPIQKVIEAFNYTDSTSYASAKSFGSETEVKSLIDRAVTSLKSRAEFADSKTKSLFTDSNNAKALFRKAYEELEDEFIPLREKYRNLISRSFLENTISGVEGIGLSRGRFEVGSEAYENAEKFFSMQRGSGYILPEDFELASAISESSSINSLAESMALMEYVIVKGLSSTVTARCNNMNGLTFPNTSLSQNANDAHETGAYSSLFYFSKYYKALGSCMLELFSVLKNENLFDKTVFHLSSEFNRSARNNGSGSDHGWAGSSSSLYSGMIKKPIIIGNIYSDGGDAYNTTSRSGGWGVGAPLAAIQNREMGIGHLASSIAASLRIESPTPNDQGLIGYQSGEIRSFVTDPPRNISGEGEE